MAKADAARVSVTRSKARSSDDQGKGDKPDGSAYYLPAWMVSEYAGPIRILARPRLPVDCLFEPRLLADRRISA
jgi:hypothetical protein